MSTTHSDLKAYPGLFANSGITDLKIIVSKEYRTPAYDLFWYLRHNTKNFISIETSTVDDALGKENLILIGHPDTNLLLAKALGYSSQALSFSKETKTSHGTSLLDIPKNRGTIRLVSYGETRVLLVLGHSLSEIAGACQILCSPQDYDLKGTELEVIVSPIDNEQSTGNRIVLRDISPADTALQPYDYESLENFLDKQKQEFHQRLQYIKQQINTTPTETQQGLLKEVVRAYTFGCFHSTIVLIGSLIEHTLRENLKEHLCVDKTLRNKHISSYLKSGESLKKNDSPSSSSIQEASEALGLLSEDLGSSLNFFTASAS